MSEREMYEHDIPLEYYEGAAFVLGMEKRRSEQHYAEIYRLEREIERLRDLLADNEIDIDDEPPYGSFPEER